VLTGEELGQPLLAADREVELAERELHLEVDRHAHHLGKRGGRVSVCPVWVPCGALPSGGWCPAAPPRVKVNPRLGLNLNPFGVPPSGSDRLVTELRAALHSARRPALRAHPRYGTLFVDTDIGTRSDAGLTLNP